MVHSQLLAPRREQLMQLLNHRFRLAWSVFFGIVSSVFSISLGAAALPPSAAFNDVSTANSGFRIRTVQADSTNALPNTIDRAEQQLAGTLIDPATQLPFT